MWDGRLVSTSVVCACLSPWLLVFVVCVSERDKEQQQLVFTDVFVYAFVCRFV